MTQYVPYIDMTGQRFGLLTVLRPSEKRLHPRIKTWECICDCGKHHLVLGDSLRRGATRSCGCLRDRRAHETHTTHGLSYSRVYKIRSNMLARCYNPHATGYAYYGGKGITVCAEWLRSPKAFYDWAMSHGYKPGLTIDRKNGAKNYTPSNCHWATRAEQMRNPTTRDAVRAGMLRFYAERRAA